MEQNISELNLHSIKTGALETIAFNPDYIYLIILCKKPQLRILHILHEEMGQIKHGWELIAIYIDKDWRKFRSWWQRRMFHIQAFWLDESELFYLDGIQYDQIPFWLVIDKNQQLKQDKLTEDSQGLFKTLVDEYGARERAQSGLDPLFGMLGQAIKQKQSNQGGLDGLLGLLGGVKSKMQNSDNPLTNLAEAGKSQPGDNALLGLLSGSVKSKVDQVQSSQPAGVKGALLGMIGKKQEQTDVKGQLFSLIGKKPEQQNIIEEQQNLIEEQQNEEQKEEKSEIEDQPIEQKESTIELLEMQRQQKMRELEAEILQQTEIIKKLNGKMSQHKEDEKSSEKDLKVQNLSFYQVSPKHQVNLADSFTQADLVLQKQEDDQQQQALKPEFQIKQQLHLDIHQKPKPQLKFFKNNQIMIPPKSRSVNRQTQPNILLQTQFPQIKPSLNLRTPSPYTETIKPLNLNNSSDQAIKLPYISPTQQQFSKKLNMTSLITRRDKPTHSVQSTQFTQDTQSDYSERVSFDGLWIQQRVQQKKSGSVDIQQRTPMVKNIKRPRYVKPRYRVK